jgi:hypothetical protein
MALLVGLALAVGVGLFIAWIARRRNLARPGPVVLVNGTSWFEQEGCLVGPCCEVCRVQAMVRPLLPAAGDVALYELCCPQCGKVPVRHAFTLLELLELERLAERAWNETKSRLQVSLSSPRQR